MPMVGGEKYMDLTMNNKGQAQGLILVVLGFFGVGLIGAIYVIVLAALGDSTTNVEAEGVINNTIDLFTNFSSQFGTVGTVAGVLLLLVILAAAGIGGYMAWQRYR
jgi:uncharacterized membrane protein